MQEHTKMPSGLWHQINDILKGHYGYGVEWYKEYNFLNKKENEEVFYAGDC